MDKATQLLNEIVDTATDLEPENTINGSYSIPSNLFDEIYNYLLTK